MTTDQFNQSVNAEIRRLMENKAVQVCSAGEWPETDYGGNFDPSRREANFAFSEWLDSHQDAIVPSSMSEWLQQNDDSIFIE